MNNLLKKTFFHFLILTAFIAGGFFAIQNKQNASAQIVGQNIDFFIDWSAETYVPLDYQGKPLPVFRSKINLSATPLFSAEQRINENDYSFNWILDNSKALSSKNQNASFNVTKGAGDQHKIYLRIFDKNNNIIKEAFFTVPISAPKITLWKETDDGSLANIEKEISANPGSNIKFAIKPFFFNKIANENYLKYQWKLNGAIIAESSSLSLAIPREVPPGTRYNLNIATENPLDIYQITQDNYIIKTK